MSDKKDIFSESFTGKYTHLADVVREARASIKSIDEKLASLPKSPQPVPTPDGKGYGFDGIRQGLLNEKAEKQRVAFEKVGEATKDDGKEVQANYLDKTSILMDPKNSFVDKSEKDSKTEIESNDYLAFKLRNKADAKAVVEAEKCATDRFDEMLSSYRNQKKDEPGKSFETKDTAQKENPEKADMTGAERFEASLGSSYKVNKDDITKSAKEPSEPSDNLE